MAGIHSSRRWAVFLIRLAAVVIGLLVLQFLLQTLAVLIIALAKGAAMDVLWFMLPGRTTVVAFATSALLAAALAKFSIPLAAWLTPPDALLGAGSCARCGHVVVRANKGVCPECGLPGQ